MKRQTLILCSVFLGAALMMLIPISIIYRMEVRAEDREGLRREPFGNVTLEVPGVFGPPRAWRDGPWEIREYKAGQIGALRLASQSPQGTLDQACINWLHLPSSPQGVLRYQAAGEARFFKEVPLMGKGAYAMRRHGKMVYIIAIFDQGTVRHWAEFRTTQTFLPFKEVFDRMLASIRASDGTGPGSEFSAAVSSTAREGHYQFFQPMAILLVIPLLPLLVIFSFVGFFRRLSGRAPESQNLQRMHFVENGAEICIAVGLQRQFMNATVGVDSEGLTLFTFRKPLLVVPKNAFAGRITTGKAFLGLPYLELHLQGQLDFRKQTWRWRNFRKAITLRIYTRDIQRLRSAMQ